jgi:DNA repair protein RecO
MRYEGILIHKTPYKERDLICDLLMRHGQIFTVYFYGGQGGGKKQKPTMLEMGNLISFELKRQKTAQEIAIASEWEVGWHPKHFRTNVEAYYLACFYFEIMSKIAPKSDLNSLDQDLFQGLFNVTSNGLYFLDQAVNEKKFSLNQQMYLFIVKLLAHLGINPQLEECTLCATELNHQHGLIFGAKDGGFICHNCFGKSELEFYSAKLLNEEVARGMLQRTQLKQVMFIEFKNYQSLSPTISKELWIQLFHFLCFQFHLSPQNFKMLEYI